MRSLIRRPRNQASDPAPSRWSWRMQRLMLTPAFRLTLRAGLPMALAFGAGTAWLADETNRQMVRDTVFEARASFEARPEFMVHLMAVDGAADTLVEEIREVVPQDFPVSSFDLDLPAIRAAISGLSPVKSATVRIRPGGVLQVDVEPRRPVVIWRTPDGLALIDVTGAHVAHIPKRMARPDLPLIAGEGADQNVKEALSLYRAAAPLGGRLRGIVRMGDRRWDVVLDRDQRILLPEEGAVEALDRVIAMDSAQDVLARDIRRIDLRLGTRPTVQMTDYATGEWWEIRQVSGQ
ncbi:cell division protein FtsQ/DivIB [uncultured Roseobacter sp.]|uniref:cell division protein FtsQ/DivIB n=1 Tax=uncultured Roseobacter sp. TaxID=114847 RepID=UPI002633C471|nr:cell division protein FtsQ/DivIB [uncultured Roseobacter sp.]